ncbi:MAG: DNA polymerase V [Bacteroidetes bacterium 4484_276]|nr:MAG: DNA polymerase V [Bacteroidetes bacterium 4484_276]
MDTIFLFIGMLIGIAATWLYFKPKLSRPNPQIAEDMSRLTDENKSLSIKSEVDNEKIKSLLVDLEYSKNQIESKEKSILELTKNLTAKSSDYQHLSEKLKGQKQDLEDIREKFSVEFKNLANEILDEKSKKFTEQNKTNLDQILKPLGEKIKEFEKKVDDVYDKEAQQRFSLKEEVKRLAELNQQVSKEAHNLTQALKGQSKTQGNWGELILENILERSGLVKDREYFVQKSFTDDNGKRLQPDVVITYPGDKNVVVDSKVSLTAYEKYTASEFKEEQDAALKEHLISIKKHIDELHSKNYQHIYELNSLDFVMMFMPVEPAFLLAIRHDPGLWGYAYDRGVLLISPTNLIAAIKMVAGIWQQEYQSRNVLEIADESGKLYDKFVGLVDDLVDVGRKLKTTQISYENSMKKLSEGKGNLVSRVEKIRKLGAKASKELPKAIIERANGE